LKSDENLDIFANLNFHEMKINIRKLKKAFNRLSKLPKHKYLFFYIKNKMVHLALKLTKSTKVAYPSTIMLELTNRCNLSCSTCAREYDYGKKMDLGAMDENHAKKIIDELWCYLDSVGLTGMGETFLYPNIKNIVDYIKLKNKGIIISVSTNAMVPNFIEQITPLIGLIDTLQVSIDGLGEIYESIRKRAKFEFLQSNLETLVNLCKNTKTTVMMNMVVTKENYLQMADLVKFAQKTGIKYMDFTMFNLAAVTQIDKSYYDLYKSPEFLTALHLLKETQKQVKEVLVSYHSFNTNHSFQACPFPWSHFYICWNGFITPCCAKPFPKELHFGNVFDTGVMKVLNNEPYRNWRNGWLNNHTPAFCDKCHFTS
jgi:MoaA/NifB/PqqE/SkfB family radical SAM enzyme